MHQYRYSIADLEVLESKKTHISNWIFYCLVFILNGNGYLEASSTAAEGDPLTSRNCRINRNTFTDKAARPSDLKSEPHEEADRNGYEYGGEHIFSERCLVTQISNLTIKARKKWTIRLGFAELEA